jgi:methyl-accepting chemotaxis protein
MGAVREQVGALSTSLQAVDATMKGQATALGDAAREARAVAQSFGSIARDLPAAIAPIRASAEQFASAGSSMALAVGNASSSIEQANNQSKRLGELLTQSSALLQNSWTAYKERFEKVDDDLKAAFASLASGLDQYQQRVHSFLAELDKSFSDALGRIAGAVQGLNDSIEELADAMGSKRDN